MLEDFLRERVEVPFSVVSNPEFLQEGNAVENFLHPDRIILGYQDEDAVAKVEQLYLPMVDSSCIYKMSNESAELTKYASNCILASRISFINEIAKVCEAYQADIRDVVLGMGK